jgi:hypothetical protein
MSAISATMNGNRRASAKHRIEVNVKAMAAAADIFLPCPPAHPGYFCKCHREGSIAIGESAKPGRCSLDTRDRGGTVDGPADVGVLVVRA